MGLTKPLICFLLLTFSLVSGAQSQNTIYVKTTASGLNNGTSWDNAFTDLEDAIAASTNGDVIWVAAGTYKPGKTSPLRASTFALKANVSVYGGFSGNEILFSERDFDSNVTILSGEIGVGGISDNCYHVISSSANDTTDLLDGFTICDANGGGLFLKTGNGLTVRNCIFTNNYANSGAAIVAGTGNLNLFNCSFLNNTAVASGAGISENNCNLKIYNCHFSGNSSEQAGDGIVILSNKSLIMRECTFSNNFTTGNGIGVVSCFGSYSIRKCSFTNNSVFEGGGIFTSSFANDLIIDSCVFNGNVASEYGSAIYAIRKSLISNCQFLNNSSKGAAVHYTGGTGTKILNCEFTNNEGNVYGGGAISSIIDGEVEVKGCKFSYNKCVNGGAIFLSKCKDKIRIEDCEFLGNKASSNGGAINVQYSNVEILRCKFTKDSAGYNGGALFLLDSNQVVKQCTFIENYSGLEGGGIAIRNNKFKLINSTLYNNRSNFVTGGGLFNSYSVKAELINSIIWHCKASTNNGITAQLVNSNGTSSSITYCLIDQWSSGGLGNLNSDPWFKDTLTNDVRLYKCSPAINAGTPDTSSLLLQDLDLANQPRVLQNRIDIGAYEELMGNNSPQVSDQTFAIDENVDGIISIGTISSSDPDVPYQSLTYMVNSGNEDNAFQINYNTGLIELLTRQNYEVKNQYSLMITVKDNCTNNILSSNAVITININDLIDLPQISTDPVINISDIEASSGGEQLNDGGGNISAKGVCWSTSPHPTIANSLTNDGTGTADFISSISGLDPGTTYYLRAYATNSIGTAYGNEVSFITDNATGLNNTIFESNIYFYPNPTTGQVKIDFNLLDATVYGLEIINAQGIIMYKENIDSCFNDHSEEIDLNTLSNGVYCIQLFTSRGTVRKKLILNK